MGGYIDFGMGASRKLSTHKRHFHNYSFNRLLRVGDGKTFPRNPRSDELLARLANELVKADMNS